MTAPEVDERLVRREEQQQGHEGEHCEPHPGRLSAQSAGRQGGGLRGPQRNLRDPPPAPVRARLNCSGCMAASWRLKQPLAAWQGSCMLCCCCCGSRQGLGASQPAAGIIWNTPILQQPTQPPGAMADQHEDGQEAFLTDEAGQLEGEVLADLEGSAEGEPPALRHMPCSHMHDGRAGREQCWPPSPGCCTSPTIGSPQAPLARAAMRRARRQARRGHGVGRPWRKSYQTTPFTPLRATQVGGGFV